MNSEIYETAAWRNFGMLDGDEAAGFDDAMRLDPALHLAHSEVECLSAALAAVLVAPVVPRAGQLEQLHLRLGLNAPKTTNWLAISGWATAAAVTFFFLFHQNTPSIHFTQRPLRPDARVASKPLPLAPESAVDLQARVLPDASSVVAEQEDPSDMAEKVPQVTEVTQATAAALPDVKLETQRLTQEIETLRGELESAQERDRERFEPVAGLSRPVIMRLKPPQVFIGTIAAAIPKVEEPPVSTLIGDALAEPSATRVTEADSLATTALEDFSAILIYDPAYDIGTIVVSGKIPSDPAGRQPQLWMVTEDGSPIYVGTLPEANANGAPNGIDFQFGTTSTLPTGFVITHGSEGPPVPPTAANTLLRGPR